MKKAVRFLGVVVWAVAFTLLSAAMVAAAAPFVVEGTANVDGNPAEWDLTNDFFANMHLAANPDKAVLAKLYLRYDCQTQTLYALVLTEPGHTIAAGIPLDEHYLKIGVKTLVNASAGDDGTPPDFAWINRRPGPYGDVADGWEASAPLSTGNYSNFNAHTDVDYDGSEWDTAAVPNRSIQMNIVCSPSAVTLSSFSAQSDESDWRAWVSAVGAIVAGFLAFLFVRR